MKHFTFLLLLCFYFAASGQVGIGTTSPSTSAQLDVTSTSKGVLVPRVALTSATDITTIVNPVTSLLIYNTASAGAFPNNVIPGFYYWNATKWSSVTNKSSLIPFSTGSILNGASVVSSSPILMGFGNHGIETINASGQSTMPPEVAGFSFTVPFNGTIDNLQVSADAYVVVTSSINTIGIQYDFTVFTSSAAPVSGIDHPVSPFINSPLTSSVRFGFPNIITPGSFRTSSNINSGSLTVNAGDRIGIRVRTLSSTDASASDITQLSFNATVMYTPH